MPQQRPLSAFARGTRPARDQIGSLPRLSLNSTWDGAGKPPMSPTITKRPQLVKSRHQQPMVEFMVSSPQSEPAGGSCDPPLWVSSKVASQEEPPIFPTTYFSEIRAQARTAAAHDREEKQLVASFIQLVSSSTFSHCEQEEKQNVIQQFIDTYSKHVHGWYDDVWSHQREKIQSVLSSRGDEETRRRTDYLEECIKELRKDNDRSSMVVEDNFKQKQKGMNETIQALSEDLEAERTQRIKAEEETAGAQRISVDNQRLFEQAMEEVNSNNEAIAELTARLTVEQTRRKELEDLCNSHAVESKMKEEEVEQCKRRLEEQARQFESNVEEMRRQWRDKEEAHRKQVQIMADDLRAANDQVSEWREKEAKEAKEAKEGQSECKKDVPQEEKMVTTNSKPMEGSDGSEAVGEQKGYEAVGEQKGYEAVGEQKGYEAVGEQKGYLAPKPTTHPVPPPPSRSLPRAPMSEDWREMRLSLMSSFEELESEIGSIQCNGSPE